MANVSSASPFKRQKLNDRGSNAKRPNTDRTSTTHKQASAPTSSSSSPPPRLANYYPTCFSYLKASDDEKQSISQSFRSFGTLMKLLDTKYKTINKLQATIDELQATIESQEKELKKFKSGSQTQTDGVIKSGSQTDGVIKKAVEKVAADMKTIEKMTADTQTMLRSILP